MTPGDMRVLGWFGVFTEVLHNPQTSKEVNFYTNELTFPWAQFSPVFNELTNNFPQNLFVNSRKTRPPTPANAKPNTKQKALNENVAGRNSRTDKATAN